ncbi:hypothetical protein H0O02_00570 [Candidatus Micrarchaeota archaeon]|nr:hypothetical protein [Candidatus Micrarchaeota archaeon]
MDRKKIAKEIEKISGILLVLLVILYFSLPNLMNMIGGYTVYNPDCSMRIAHMDESTVGGQIVPDTCNTARSITLVVIATFVILLLLAFAMEKIPDICERGRKK